MTMSEAVQMQYIPLDDLEYGRTRYIRDNVVEDIKERIETDGFNPARPLRVIPENGHYIVADGNHRLKTLRELKGADEHVPCVVEEGGDLYEIARESNRDEDTYAPEDLFDHLYRIDDLREEHTQAEIAEKMGEEWSKGKVKQHASLLKNVVTQVLDRARVHQKGRVTREVTYVTFNFTEGWFRTSGIYDLDAEWQEQFMEWFVDDQKCNASKGKVTRKVEDLEDIQEQLAILEAELNEGVSDEKAAELEKAIRRGEYNKASLRDAIEAANLDAKDQSYFGVDSLDKLKEFEDNTFACVVTDPPYGVEYEPHWKGDDYDEFGEDIDDVLISLYRVFEQLERVCKDNAHIYLFFSSNNYHSIRTVLEHFFEVDPVPLAWIKNHPIATNDKKNGFKRMYAHQYEPIFWCKMGNDTRELNGKISPNVLNHPIPKAGERWHGSQKPISLLEELITNSTGPGETILDPFAGSGASLLAAKKTGRHYVGIERSTDYESRFKKEVRKIETSDSEGGDSE